jgi:hypothetical protein
LCAQTPGITPRDLYYEDLPQSPGAVVPAASHLGLRYNLVKIDLATKSEQAVDPDGNYKEGDCFAIEFTPNQDGRIYILNIGSSGESQFLMPSPEMPSEANAVHANTTVRIPRDFCFRLDGKRGVETLTVAVAGDQESIDALIQKQLATQIAIAGDRESSDAGQKQAIAQVREWQSKQIAGRDIVVQKVPESETGQERPYTVYAVETAGAKGGHVVLEIKIRHE